MITLADILRFVVKTRSRALLQLTYRWLYYSDRYWAKRGKKRMLSRIHAEHPDLGVLLYDLGAAGGLDPLYLPLRELAKFRAIGFEPGREEGGALKNSVGIEFHPFAIAGASGARTLYVTKAVGSSSIYPPNAKAVSEFPIADFFAVTGTEQLIAITLDEFVDSSRAPYPDFIKLDVQGAEYEILKGSPACLQKAIGVSLETRMRELYTGEGLFPAMHSFLTDCGFRLISKLTGSPHFSGETLELDAAYVRGSDCLLTEEKLLKAVVFCILHENLTFAAHLVRNSGLMEAHKTRLLKWIRKDHGFSATPESFMMMVSLREREQQERSK